jgi:hypothetical protein
LLRIPRPHPSFGPLALAEVLPNATMSDNKGGLVRNLLLPSYTDAGANDAFQQDECQSEVSTTVLDNRTTKSSAQLQVESYMMQRGPVELKPRSINESLRTETGVSSSESTAVPPAPVAPTAAPRTTKFFPSTDPSSASPRMRPQRAPPVRSTSLTTHSGAFPPSPRQQDDGGEGSSSVLDHSSMTASSGTGSSVLGGLNFLKDEDGNDAGESVPKNLEDNAEKAEEATPLKDNRSAGSPSEKENGGSEQSLEKTETHPALTFRNIERQKQESSSDMVSDVNSTASEMGTIVGAPGRLEEVSAMAALAEQRGEHSEDDFPLDQPTTSSSSEIDDLSIPVLDEQPSKRQSGVFREPPKKLENPSASAIVSAAFRRLGNNLSSRSRSPVNASLSAPTTPRAQPRMEEYLRSHRDQQEGLPSFILRSPGSAAHFRSNERKRPRNGKPVLSPRVSDGNKASLRPRADSSPLLRHANSLASPLRFARGCLSYDTTIDGQDKAVPSEDGRHSPGAIQLAKSWTPRTPNPSSLHHSKSWDANGNGYMLSPQSDTSPGQTYQSFEFGRSRSMEGNGTAPSAFRAAPARGRIRYANGFTLQSLKTSPVVEKKDFSPAIAESSNALALRTPHRIEIEREDALDILACLVERSIVFDQELESSFIAPAIAEVTVAEDSGSDGEHGSRSIIAKRQDDDGVSTYANVGDRSIGNLLSPPKTRRSPAADLSIGRTDSFSSELAEAVKMIRMISRDYGNSQSGSTNDGTAHEARMKAIDELLRSHTYAVEMKRAAKSASAWLKSIGRPGSSEGSAGVADGDEGRVEPDDIGQVKDGREVNQSAGEEQESSTERMDVVSLKAMLHSAQLKAEEKEEQARRLNEELSKCRAEIGRLRSASRAETVFQSPNRSILDNDDESTSSTDGSKGQRAVDMLDNADTSPIPKAEGEGDLSVEASFCRSDIQAATRENKSPEDLLAIADAKKESVLLKAALAEANKRIRELHNKAHSEGQAPVVTVENLDLSKELDEYKEAVKKTLVTRATVESRRTALNLPTFEEEVESPSEADRRTINVKMLDGENFTTEWVDLPSLPPPPDHGLRSPIVAALLQQWTSDAAMHDSLLAWMDRIIRGADPETIPPLTISSLDHQVRDGFSMHVLPLLLRRSDVCVDVKTRAHRRTSYDMSVYVTRPPSAKTPGATGRTEPLPPTTQKANRAHVMAFRATSHGADGEDSQMESNESLAARKAKVSDYLRTSASASFGAQSSSDAGGPAGSVTYSSVTEHVTNQSKFRASEIRLPPSGRDHRDGMLPPAGPPGTTIISDDISIGSSMTGEGSQKSASLMGALGGAFGMLRRSGSSKPPMPVPPALQIANSIGDDMAAGGVSSFLRHAPPSPPTRAATNEGDDADQQPYHRVVSAPPGRIGVTFVDYRGHAMVSDVAPDSPLEGWIFASDILIAIDEVPVSGMRVRDIVKVLTTRKDRQRALRLISSHAMNEFTLNTTTLSEVGGP